MNDYCLPERDKVALITISAQQDFVRQDSPLCSRGNARAVPALVRVVKAFRQQGAPIFHTVRLYRPDGSNAEPVRRAAIEEGLRVLMPGSFGTELIGELRQDPAQRLDAETLFSGGLQEVGANEQVLYRPRWGAFHQTPLEDELKARNITTVVICGFNFSTGTRATIYEASARDYRIVMVPDAVCTSNEAGIAELGRIGVYLMSSDYCADWVTNQRAKAAA